MSSNIIPTLQLQLSDKRLGVGGRIFLFESEDLVCELYLWKMKDENLKHKSHINAFLFSLLANQGVNSHAVARI